MILLSVLIHFNYIQNNGQDILVKKYIKKCLVKCNPAIGLFRPSGWVTAQKVGLNI